MSRGGVDWPQIRPGRTRVGMRRRFAVGILSSAAALAIAAPAMATTRYADDQGLGGAPCTTPGTPCSLSDAIIASGIDDEIQVGGGDYNGPVVLTGGQDLVHADFQDGGVTEGPAIIDGGAGNAVVL